MTGITRELYPFADTVYQLARSGFLNAVSVSWDPIDWSFSQDRGRAGGIDFKRQELLEVSQVPVPAAPGALIAARSAGIDTAPMHEWLERALDTGGLQMLPRAEVEELRRAAKMPSLSKPKNRIAMGAPKRDIYDISELAQVVSSLGSVVTWAQWEKEWEGDDSAVPAQLLTALKLLGAALVAMTQEEVAELLAGLTDDTLIDLSVVDMQDTYIAAATSPAQRLLRCFKVLGHLRSAGAVPTPLTRAGKVLSADNETALRGALDQLDAAQKAITAVCDANAPPAPDPENDDETEAKERRLRVAKARQHRARAAYRTGNHRRTPHRSAFR